MTYSFIDLDNEKTYKIIYDNSRPCNEFRLNKTLESIDKFLKNGNPVRIILHHDWLDSEGLEEYRKFFCQEAKKVHRNCVYFEMPVYVEESK